jgi:hypothetical protein
VVRDLEAAQDQLWDLDRRRYAIRDVISGLIGGGPHSEHEYLTAQLDLAHTHMVGRDVAERAVLAAFEAPRPPKAEGARARDLLSRVLHDYGWHSSSFESTVRWVARREEEASRTEPVLRARRSQSRLAAAAALAGANPQPAATSALQPSSRPAAHR